MRSKSRRKRKKRRKEENKGKTRIQERRVEEFGRQ